MAADSEREKNILALIARLESLSWIGGANHIKRTRPTLSELKNYPDTLLPMIVVEAKLPVIDEHRPARATTKKDLFLSSLTVDIFTYFIENENQDSLISNYLDDLWNLIYTDQSNNGNCFETQLTPNKDDSILLMQPYTAFRISIILKYKHTIEGI